MREIKWIVCHCTAGPQGQRTSDILHYWKTKLGFKKPGYHHLISADGTDENLLSIDKPSNGVKNFNAHSINICYKGGVGPHGEILDNRTHEQIATMKALVLKYHAMFPNAVILGHRDFSPDKNRNGVVDQNEWIKACPCFSVRKWVEDEGILTAVPIPEVRKAVDTKSNSGVNLRRGPGTNTAIIMKIDEGTTCIIRGQQDGWSKVELSDTVSGWIKSEYLK